MTIFLIADQRRPAEECFCFSWTMRARWVWRVYLVLEFRMENIDINKVSMVEFCSYASIAPDLRLARSGFVCLVK